MHQKRALAAVFALTVAVAGCSSENESRNDAGGAQTRSLRAHLATEESSATVSVSDIAPDAETYIVCQGGESELNEAVGKDVLTAGHIEEGHNLLYSIYTGAGKTTRGSSISEDLNRQEIDLCPGDSDGVRRLSGDDELLFEQDGDTWVLQN